MRRASASLPVLVLMVLSSSSALAQTSLLYREMTGSRQVTNLMNLDDLPDGFVIRSRLSDGDTHDVRLDRSLATTEYRVTSPRRRIDYTVSRDGNALTVNGMFGGRPVSKRISIDGRPWYESLERSARDYIVEGAGGPLVFWTVHPWEANAYLLQARSEGHDQLVVNGSSVDAIRVRVAPVGILRLFWSVLYWFRADDGIFLRYEGVRGLPGTPKTIVELIGRG